MALDLLDRDPNDLPDNEYDRLLTTRAWAIGLARSLHLPTSVLLASIGSREYTEQEAYSLIERAQQELAEEQRESTRKGTTRWP